MDKKHKYGIFLLALMLCLGGTVYGQTMMGDFTGVVTDPSSAPIPGATITIINEGTHGTRTATTNANGVFRVNGLLAASYTISVEASGFKKYVQTGVSLDPAVVKPINVQLQIGAVTQTVQVTGKVPVISTESSTIAHDIPKIVEDKPTVFDARSNGYAEEALAWAPGSSAGTSIYQYQGTRPGMLQDNIEGMQRSYNYIHMNVDSVSEVHVVSMTPAEYARPTTVDAIIKSGSNRLTGTVNLAYYNPNCLNAINTPFTRTQHGACTSIWRPRFSASGPVYLPKLYDGRNKTFFYFGLQKQPLGPTISPAGNYSIPTLAMQGGDFSNYPTTIKDPTTGLPFSGNKIPAGRISSVASTIVSQEYGNSYTYVGGPNNYVANGAEMYIVATPARFWDLKIDENLKSRDTIAFSMQFGNQATQATFGARGAAIAGGNMGAPNINWNQAFISHTGSLAETHTFSPTLVNQLRAGFTRAYYAGTITKRDLTTPIYGDEVLKQWGIQGIANPPHLTGLPYVYINNWQAMNYVGSGEWDTRYIAYDNLSWVKGRHNFKTGVSFTKLLDDSIATGPFWGYFTFTGQFTGEPFADFLLGLPGTFQTYSGRPVAARRMWEDGAFFQDEFRATRKLTLSYGLRWDKFTVPYDKNGMYYNFDPSTLSLVMPSQKALQNVSPAWPTSTFPVKLASAAGYPSKLVNGSSSWQPRLGFAYKFGDRTVLRGGYGVYSGALRFNGLQTGGPFALTSTYINSADPTSATGAKYAWPNPFPSTTSVASVLSATGVSKNYRDPYTQNWQLSLERQLAPNWGLRTTYMGVAGAQLIWNQNLNQEVASTSTYSASRLPYPGLQSIGYVQNGASSIYHSIQVLLTHPWASGIYTTVAYTHSWNRTDSYSGTLVFDQTSYGPEYSYNLRRDWGNDVQDVPNDLIVNWVADVPLGRGKRFGSNANRFLNAVIGNWTLSGVFSDRSGIWFTPVASGTDIGNIGNTSSRRPDLVPGCDPYAGARNVHGKWYNSACFAIPANGQLGSAQINSLEGPPGWTVFLDPYKDFPLKFREGATLRIGAQLFNLFNHPIYAVPNATVTSASAGIISGTAGARGQNLDESGQRGIFFSARLIF